MPKSTWSPRPDPPPGSDPAIGPRDVQTDLTRVSATEDSLVVSMQRGGGSKDLWVRAEHDEVSPVTLLYAVRQLQ